MEVTALFWARTKGQPPQSPARLELTAGAPGDQRQISLLSSEARAAVEHMGRRGLCMERFFANLEISGLPPLSPGERLVVGGAVLEITAARKRCFPQCPLVQEGTECPLQMGCRFARVVREGDVSPQDPVFHCEEKNEGKTL